MASQSVSDAFERRYNDSAQYPLNMSNSMLDTSPGFLKRLNEQLNEVTPQLFRETEDNIVVPWRDIGVASKDDVKKMYIYSSDDLNKMMNFGIDSSTMAVTASQHDPQCRFVYLFGNSSLSVLNITRSMFTRILTFHQVMPAYLEFVMAFGLQDEPKDLRFSGFTKQICLAPCARMPNNPHLDRSGQQYQLCYNLKHIERNEEGGFTFIRQAAIHHQFDVVTGKTLWIVTAGRRNLQERYWSLTGLDAKPQNKSFKSPVECLSSSLATHTMFCSWSAENWRWYIKWLENNLEQATGMAVYGRREQSAFHQNYQSGDLQTLQRHEDMLHETMLALDANQRVMNSLHKFYVTLKDNKDFPLRQEGAEYIDVFTDQLENFLSEIEHLVQRAATLLKVTNGRKELVAQHYQSQSTENMERLNRNMEREAILVRIITIVTLIYLPATFVSTFFSTDVIKYQNIQGDAGNFSYTAMVRWLQVALPLTALTLLLAWLWNRRVKQQLPFGQEMGRLLNWPFGKRKISPILPVHNEKAPTQ